MVVDDILDADCCIVIENIFCDLSISRDGSGASNNNKEFDGTNDVGKEGSQEGKLARKARKAGAKSKKIDSTNDEGTEGLKEGKQKNKNK